jgi:hypothetical protein
MREDLFTILVPLQYSHSDLTFFSPSLYSTQFPLPSPTPQTFLIDIPFRIHLPNCIYGTGGAKRRQKTSVDTHLLTQIPGYRDPGYRDPGYRDPGYRDPGYRDPGYRDHGYRDHMYRYISTEKYKTVGYIGILLYY